MILHAAALEIFAAPLPHLFYMLGFVGIFLIPGRLIVGALALGRFRFLMSVALSLLLNAINLTVLQAAGAPVSWFLYLLSAESALAALLWIVRLIVAGRRNAKRPGHLRLGLKGQWRLLCFRLRRRRAPLLLWLALMAALVVYLAFAGPYMELPSDSLEHVRRFQAQSAMLNGHEPLAEWFYASGDNVAVVIRDGRWTPEGQAGRIFVKQGMHWYFLHAWLCRAAGLQVTDSLLTLSLCTVATLLSGIYTFAMGLFAGFRFRRTRKAWAAAAATLFFGIQAGTLGFAYIRYYALAPTIMNYSLFLAGAALALEFFTRPALGGKAVMLTALMAFAANVIHSQEAAFLFFTSLALSAVAVWNEWLAPALEQRLAKDGKEAGAGISMKQWKALAGFVVMFGAYAGLFFWIHRMPQHELDPRFVVPMQALLPFMRGLLIQPPWGQFYETVTTWGLFVYAAWLFAGAGMRRNILITAGMLLPLFTVFNPMTTDMITRFSPISMSQLWRMSYALPLYAVAGWLAVEALCGLWRSRPGTRRLRHAALLTLLILLMLPWHGRYFANAFSRLPRLARTPQKRDVRHYMDLLKQLDNPGADFLSKFGREHLDRSRLRVITDPLTACLINRWTLLNCMNCGFTETHFRELLAGTHTDDELQGALRELDTDHDWLLVINERDGDISPAGTISRHWPGDVLKTSRHYSPELKAYAAAHPELCSPLWEQNNIAIYAISRRAMNANKPEKAAEMKMEERESIGDAGAK